MSSKRSYICLFLLMLGATAHAAVDLTPTPHEYVASGIKNRELLFADRTKDQQQRQVSYTPPAKWSWRYSATALIMIPPDVSQAEAAIEPTQVTTPREFDDAYVRELVEIAVQSLPPGSQNVTVVEQQKNPVLMGGNATFRVVVSYETYGHAFKKSMTFLNLPDCQLAFRLIARKDIFDGLDKEFRGSLFSWQWV